MKDYIQDNFSKLKWKRNEDELIRKQFVCLNSSKGLCQSAWGQIFKRTFWAAVGQWVSVWERRMNLIIRHVFTEQIFFKNQNETNLPLTNFSKKIWTFNQYKKNSHEKHLNFFKKFFDSWPRDFSCSKIS